MTTSTSLTLAQRVQQARQALSMSQEKLAELANLPLNQIQDIEGGLELFLAPAVRQKLARVLKIGPGSLKILEKPPVSTDKHLSEEARERYKEEILHFPKQPHYCPMCRARLEVRVFHRKDLEDNPLIEVKAHCISCLFKL